MRAISACSLFISFHAFIQTVIEQNSGKCLNSKCSEDLWCNRLFHSCHCKLILFMTLADVNLVDIVVVEETLKLKADSKQECIPIGCVPPARYRTWKSPPGQRPPSPWTETPWTETPLDRNPQTETLLDRDSLDRDPPIPGLRPPGQRPPSRGQTGTCENITFANFVCGG